MNVLVRESNDSQPKEIVRIFVKLRNKRQDEWDLGVTDAQDAEDEMMELGVPLRRNKAVIVPVCGYPPCSDGKGHALHALNVVGGRSLCYPFS